VCNLLNVVKTIFIYYLQDDNYSTDFPVLSFLCCGLWSLVLWKMRSKSLSCFFCGGPGRIKTAQNAKKPVKLDDNNVEIINMWEEKCVVSTCRMLKIPTTHPAVTALLEETQKYCDECMQTMRDLEFTVGAMDKLQRSIRKLRRILLNKLEWKYETMEKPIGKESSSLTSEGEPFDLFGFVFQSNSVTINM